MKQAVLFATLLLLASTALAQTTQRKPQIGVGAWWRNPEYAGQLKLTDAQVKDFEQSFSQHNLKIADASADAQRENVRLDSLSHTDAGQPELVAQANKVVEARCRLMHEQALAYFEARRILSTEQWHKMQALRASTTYENPSAPASK